MMAACTPNNDVSWIRKNIAVLIATFSLMSSVVGWYASYAVLVYRVEITSQAIEKLHMQVVSVSEEIKQHHQDANIHVNPNIPQDLFNRLTRIENLLIEHMGKKEPQ
jgi:hypothetical protein